MTAITPITLPGQPAFDEALCQKLRAALAAQGKDYEPRTHHKAPDGQPKFINRLIFETSPYLLQHAHNPVSWRPWGKEAFEEAKRLGRPVLLSVGYSTCHWCHVMERESFEDEEIAAYINQNYIAIKVDREERPDVDSVYMTTVQLMTGGGGWPMTVVMIPDGRPFFAGTYFPARDGDRGARVGFLTILQKLKDAFDKEKTKVVESADQLTAALDRLNQDKRSAAMPGSEALIQAARSLAERFDPKWGGFGRAPKFPRPSTYELLLRYGRRANDAGALRIVTESLTHMANGGIYDHVGGGFARYSTDTRWLVPHFEKMLYDNAQLVSLLVETWQASGEPRFKAVAMDVLDYVLKEMTGPHGGFYSATDADSEGEEGKFFVWTPDEIDEVLGPDLGKVARTYYSVSQAGNFEGHNILHRMVPEADIAKQLGLTTEVLRTRMTEAREKLYAARKKRIPPLLDDKVLTEWNAQMISAFAKAGFAFREDRYLEAARTAATFLGTTLQKDGRLLRAYRSVEGKGAAKHMGVLEDYAFFIAALLDLYEATGELRWLDEALELETSLETHFWDKERGGFFGTADDAETLLIREKPLYDGAQPSGNSVAALNLYRFYELTTNAIYKERADRTLHAFGEPLEKGALECPKLAQALDFALDKPKEIAVVTSKDDDGADLIAVLTKTFLPNRVIVVANEADLPTLQKRVPWVEGKRAMSGRATAYVCLAQTCKKPTSDPEELARQLAEVHALSALPLPIPN